MSCAACCSACSSPSAWTIGLASVAAAADLVVAAGDIACDPRDPDFNDGRGSETRRRQLYTSDLLVDGQFAQVLALGDLQYERATLANFQPMIAAGAGSSITRPVPATTRATGRVTSTISTGRASGSASRASAARATASTSAPVIDCRSTPPATGSPASRVRRRSAGCGAPISPPIRRPARYRSAPPSLQPPGQYGDSTSMQAIWQDLYAAWRGGRAQRDSHNYERFAPQDGCGSIARTGYGSSSWAAPALFPRGWRRPSPTASGARTRPSGCWSRPCT